MLTRPHGPACGEARGSWGGPRRRVERRRGQLALKQAGLQTKRGKAGRTSCGSLLNKKGRSRGAGRRRLPALVDFGGVARLVEAWDGGGLDPTAGRSRSVPP